MWLFLLVCVGQATPFVSVWRTTLPDENVSLPLLALPFNLTVNWGDLSPLINYTALPITHNFSVAGDYVISIDGVVSDWEFSNGVMNQPNANNLISIRQWGEFTVGPNAHGAFRTCTQLSSITASDAPIFLPDASLNSFFRDTTMLSTNVTLMGWQTGNVADFGNMFDGSSFNAPLAFNTSSALSLAGMFANSSFNQPLNFATKTVTDMSRMFYGTSSFNQSLSFDTSNVITMKGMFQLSGAFNTPLQFNTSQTGNLEFMFDQSVFTQDVSTWPTDNATQCQLFCSTCGLPAFPNCQPCTVFPEVVGPIDVTTTGRKACVCPSGEICDGPSLAPTTTAPTTVAPTQSLAPTSVAPSSAPNSAAPTPVAPTPAVAVACLGPAYNGTAGQCVCGAGFAGNVSYVGNTTTGCGLVCVGPAYTGTPGQCVCGAGFTGSNVSYVGSIAVGCVKAPTPAMELTHTGLNDGEISAIAVPLLLLSFLFMVGFLAGVYKRSRKTGYNSDQNSSEMMPVA